YLTSQADSTIELNGVSIALNNGTAALSIDNAVEAINDQSIATGVTAKKDDAGTGIVLVDSSGSPIEVNAAGTVSPFANLTNNIDATFEAGLTLSVDGNATLTVTGAAAAAGVLGLDGPTESSTLQSIDISDRPGANDAIETTDSGLNQINSNRGTLGATQNRFESTIANLATTAENLSAANSRILDADFAAETAKLSKSQVLQQAGISVLAQANARPQQVLSLLQ